MNTSDDSAKTATYSPFWAVSLVLLVITILLGFDMAAGLQQRSYIHSTLEKAQPTLAEAHAVRLALNGLSRDLLMLQDKSPEAKKIVQEFGIKAVVAPQAKLPKK